MDNNLDTDFLIVVLVVDMGVDRSSQPVNGKKNAKSKRRHLETTPMKRKREDEL